MKKFVWVRHCLSIKAHVTFYNPSTQTLLNPHWSSLHTCGCVLFLSFLGCDALVLEKESSPVYGFHLAVLLLDMFSLLPVLTVRPVNSQGCQKWCNNGGQLWWHGKKWGSWSLSAMRSWKSLHGLLTGYLHAGDFLSLTEPRRAVENSYQG